ncbi:MAG: 3-methyl-2-oxobutanoate hydroxymethyltransferase [Chitinispirillaceae bacterium]|nr:3-methyl-2-oxobutanoate hydroxymethyltransferase [Chitinispirillaceae bacterium]
MCQKFHQLFQKKKHGIPIAMVTAYDYPTARIEEEVGIDVILVGDSVGTNVLGYETEREVTMADMLHHLKAVVRGAPESCVMADLPYGAAPDPQTAFENAQTLTRAGARIVKIEGWEERTAVVAALSERGIAVCGHIGYNPQVHGPKGRVFGKEASVALELIRSAQSLERAGAMMLIAEKIPEELGRLISSMLSIPAIGIGSGRYCDGQVLVFHDIVGLAWRTFRHARAYTNIKESTTAALLQFKTDVASGAFPAEEQVSHLSRTVLDEVAGAGKGW